MACLIVRGLEETRRLGAALARAVRGGEVRAILLRGPVGSGKTTLTRALVRALPGGEAAEVASPSFTLCNRYPTRPPVLHGDLYRCAPRATPPGVPRELAKALPDGVPDELLDGLDTPGLLTVLEWADHLPDAELPQEYLDIRLQPCEEGRLLTLRPHGPCAHNAGRCVLKECADMAGPQNPVSKEEDRDPWIQV